MINEIVALIAGIGIGIIGTYIWTNKVKKRLQVALNKAEAEIDRLYKKVEGKVK